MFGDRYLVAPILWPGCRERDVVLPAGFAWRDVDTGETWPGGQRIRLEAPLDRIPVLEKI